MFFADNGIRTTTMITVLAAAAGALIWWHAGSSDARRAAAAIPPAPAVGELRIDVGTAGVEPVPALRVPSLEPQPLPEPPAWSPPSAASPRPRTVIAAVAAPTLCGEENPGISVPALVRYDAPSPDRHSL